MRIYGEVGHDGVMLPDHAPHLVGIGPDKYASWAFPLGYMRALMHVVEADARQHADPRVFGGG